MRTELTYSNQFRSIFICLAMLLLSYNAWGQNLFISRADKAFEEMAYPEAIQLYEKGLKSKFDKNAMLNLADAYRFTNDNTKALEAYAKLVTVNQVPPVTFLYYGQCLIKAGKYDEAIKWLERFEQEAPADSRAAAFLKTTERIDRLFRDSSDFKIIPFEFNSEFDDFGPSIYNDGILFSSSRGDADLIRASYERNNQPFLDIYFSKLKKKANPTFSLPTLMRGDLNTRFHEGSCSWDSVRNVVYFTRNNFSKGKKIVDAKGIMQLKIFSAEVNSSGAWEYEAEFPFNNDAYSVGHPAVVPGENWIVFASDQPGGFGGTDLYLAKQTESGWENPQNLGPEINTPGNELFPYISASGDFYFSSDGLGGLGGLDIFHTKFALNAFDPENLGYPINSPDDDFGFLLSDDHTWGMFSSNRQGGKGGDDIYLFSYEKPIFQTIVVDAETNRPIPNAIVRILSYDKEDEQSENTNENGQADFLLRKSKRYHISAEADQYRPSTLEIKSSDNSNTSIQSDTIKLQRPAIHVVTKVLDPITGTPIIDAKVQVSGSKLSYKTNEAGEVDFYYDPYPEYQKKPLDCQAIEPINYCYTFSDEGFFDFDTLKLIYEWDFGDGSHARGLEVRHCYSKPGNYHVTLNLLEPSGAIFLNQSSYNLEIRNQSALQIVAADTVTKGRKVYFDAKTSAIPDCEIQSYQWTIGKDVHYTGERISHVFHKAGIYKIKLEVGGKGPTPEACGNCGTKEIVVLEEGWQSNPIDSLIEAWYNMDAPRPDFSKTDCQAQKAEDYCYQFEDKGGLISDSLPFSYIWDFGDGKQLEGEKVRHCFDLPGLYPIQLIVVDPLTGQQISVLSEYELDVRDLHQVYIDTYDTVALGQTFDLDALKSDLDGCKINSVWWDFGDRESSPGPVVSYQYFQEGTYRVQMVVSGTSEDGKQACSKCSFKEITVIKGHRQSGKNADFGNPISVNSENDIPNGTILLEIEKEGYEARKISFSPSTTEALFNDQVSLEKKANAASPKFESEAPKAISSTGDPNTLVKINVKEAGTNAMLSSARIIVKNAKNSELIGAYKLAENGEIYLPLDKTEIYYLYVQHDGYLSERELIGPVNSLDKLSANIKLRRIQIGSTWELKDVYYDYGKSQIRNDAAWELTKFAEFLRENPELRVELSSHTDARGSDDFNLKLSEERAQSALTFLLDRGIPSTQVTAKGYGETMLRNQCGNGVNCTEAKHQENRRTEIRIVGYSGMANTPDSNSQPIEEKAKPEEIAPKVDDSPKLVKAPENNTPKVEGTQKEAIVSPKIENPSKEVISANPPEKTIPQTEKLESSKYTILLGTFASKQIPARFEALDASDWELIREVPSGGFFRYYLNYYSSEQIARAKLMEIISKGFRNASVIKLSKD